MRGISFGKPERVTALDEFRGLCILLMIVYHGFYDLVYMFGVDFPAFYSPGFRALQLFIACGFIFTAGISSRYSRGNLRRGAIVFCTALAMTLATFTLMRSQLVVFGVLHMLGVCMILHGLIFRNNGAGFPAFPALLACLALFVLTWGVSGGYIGLFDIPLINLPGFLYRNYFLSPLGFLSVDFYSSDYFPLLPWVFWFFAGSFMGVAFRQGMMPAFFYRHRNNFLGRMGKRSLIIYVLHQPVLYGLLSLIFLILRYFGLYS